MHSGRFPGIEVVTYRYEHATSLGITMLSISHRYENWKYVANIPLR